MKSFIYLFIISVGWLFTYSTSANAQEQTIKIVVLGDSLTANHQIDSEDSFPMVLEKKLLSLGYRTEVINMSVPGQTSTDARKRIDELLMHNPDIAIIQLGYNDVMRGISPTKITYINLHEMLYELRTRKIGTILMGIKAPSRDREYRTELDYIYRTIVKAHQATLYLDAIDGLRDRPDLTLADGIHPNAKGVLAMVHNITPYITPLIKWRIDLQNFKKSSK